MGQKVALGVQFVKILNLQALPVRFHINLLQRLTADELLELQNCAEASAVIRPIASAA